MSDEFVPSVGPVLPAKSGAVLDGVRGTSNALAVAPAAAATAAIFAAGELISVRTRVANEQIRVTLNVERDNAGAAGNGTFRITDAGVPIGPTRIGPTGTAEQGTSVIDAVIAIAAPGTHTIGAQVTSNGDVETVLAGSTMVVEADEFA